MNHEQWEIVLPEALHSIGLLFCTATNTTPRKRFFSFQRKSSVVPSLPSWLTCPRAKSFLLQFVRTNKTDPLVDKVEVLNVNTNYAHVRHLNGREVTVFLRDFATYPSEANHSNKQDLPERSSDDIENDMYDQMPTEENRNRTEGPNALAPPNAVVSRSTARTNKGVLPFQFGIPDSIV